MPAFLPWNMDPSDTRCLNEEASRDPGVQSTTHHDYSEKDFEGHRVQNTVYVGFHVPNQKRHSHHRRHRHHRRSGTGSDDSDRPITPPAQRVQFILGEEIDDDMHESHPLFSEMEELFIEDGEIEWRETARFIKFEEEVEEGGNRWSKPHVATLSLHSLFELRSCIMHGAVMLDMEAQTLEQITDLLVENWFNTGQLSFDNKDRVRDTLLRRHRHQHQRKANSSTNVSKLPIIRSLAEIGRNYSSNRSSNQLQIPTTAATVPDLTHSHSAATIDENGHSDYHMKSNLNFMKKIPQGAETSNILVGELDFLEKMISGFVRLTQATMLGDLTEVPVPTRFIFVLLGPLGGGSRYHEIGRGMATLMSDEVFHDVAYKGKNRNHLLAGVDEFLDAVTVLPPGEWDPNIRIEPPNIIPSQDGRKHPEKPPIKEEDEEVEEVKLREEMGLVRTGRLFGGLINDIKRKAPWYLSDFKDALAIQCVAAWIFLYFACLTPIITFGGLLGEATENRMAAIESLVSGFVCGIIYGLFSGQPLTILGSTGPVLVFETILYDFCSSNGLEYLSFRWCIGLWVGVILIILVMIDASYLVVYITRFTEENFATLIALIFIIKAVAKVLHIGHDFPMTDHPGDPLAYDCVCQPTNTTPTSLWGVPWVDLNRTECDVYNGTLVGSNCGEHSHHPDVFLMSIILFCGTFFVSVILKDFRTSTFFPTKVRELVSDFAVIISILSMSTLDACVGILTPKLHVPEKFSPTWEGRGWFIHPLGNNPWWTILAAPIPALLATILIFMDQQISAVIVNRKENKLKKGCGYHLDLFVLALLIIFCSIMGLPWFVAATVLSINHVNSLKLESKSAAPGEKPKFLGVREQRVTHVLIFILVGLSVVLTPVLKFIPMPVLFGVFLYMGMSSLKGLQFFDRILIMFMPVKYQPDFMFLRQVELKRVHLFTFIQLACLIVLWLIKSFKKTSILFPLMLVVMIGVRKCLDFVFTERELKILDDVMPEFSKRKELEEGLFDETDTKEEKTKGLTVGPSGNFQITLPNGNVMKIPSNQINISEEMNKSGVWKQVNNSVDMGNKKSSSEKKNSDKKGKKRSTSKDSGTEEERKRLSIIQDDDEDDGITIRIDPAERDPKNEETNV